MTPDDTPAGERERADFIREIIAADLRGGTHDTVVTRFPLSPTGTFTSGTPSPSA